jgi:hypothetical protein
MSADELLYCSLCGFPLEEDGRPWQPSLGGGGAHYDCIEDATLDEEGEDRADD